jgi:hypothetical protein
MVVMVSLNEEDVPASAYTSAAEAAFSGGGDGTAEAVPLTKRQSTFETAGSKKPARSGCAGGLGETLSGVFSGYFATTDTAASMPWA